MAELETAAVVRLLRTGTLEIEGALPWSSNYAFLARVCGQVAGQNDVEILAVYKPRRGERPLWDFARGTLCQREQAAFVISQAVGWELVPATVLREDEYGLGSLQHFINHDPDHHYFTIQGEAGYRRPLQQMALLDVVINNADRKGGHVLLEERSGRDGAERQPRLWGIDHGICFHSDYKLRTVIWEFAGEPISPDLLGDLATLENELAGEDGELWQQLGLLLSSRERVALKRRLRRLLAAGRFPHPGPGRHYPWPPV